jgi:hypothetical protein
MRILMALANGFPDRDSSISGATGNHADAFPAHAIRDANMFVLIHFEHPLSFVAMISNIASKDLPKGGQFSVIV